MRNYEQEQYAFLAHYGVPGMKRPHGLRYKTKGRTVSGGVSDDIGDMAKKAKRRKFITNATSKINKSVSDDTMEFYKNKAKGESKNSLRLKRIAQVRATEAMAPVAAAQDKLFKKKKKKNSFMNTTFVQPGLEARKPENQASHNARKAIKKATEKTTNPFVNGNMRKSMEKQIEKAKKRPSNAVNTGIKASGSNFFSDNRKAMEKTLEKAKRTNRSTYEKPSKTTKTTYVTYIPRDKNTNAPRPGHTDEKIMSAKDTTVKSKLYKKQKKK